MAKERWTHSNTTVYNIGYHIIWCPKYRRKVLQSPVYDKLEVLLREKADERGCRHCGLVATMSNHVDISPRIS